MSDFKARWKEATPEQRQKFVNNLEILLFGDPSETDEPEWLNDPAMVDLYLRWNDYDPIVIGERTRAMVDKLIAKHTDLAAAHPSRGISSFEGLRVDEVPNTQLDNQED